MQEPYPRLKTSINRFWIISKPQVAVRDSEEGEAHTYFLAGEGRWPLITATKSNSAMRQYNQCTIGGIGAGKRSAVCSPYPFTFLISPTATMLEAFHAAKLKGQGATPRHSGNFW